MKFKTKILAIIFSLAMIITMLPMAPMTVKADCVHSNMKRYIAIPPKCTESGRHEFYQCEQCGLYFHDAEATKKVDDSSWTTIPATGHKIEVTDAVAPTCVDPGVTAKVYCSVCEEVFLEATPIPAVPHKCKTIVKKATASKDGLLTEWCTVCGTTVSETVIPKASDISLSATSFKYSGDKITPVVTIKDSKGKKISSDNYTITYSNNKKVGTAKVTIKFKNKYSGTVVKKFKITK